MSHAPPLPHPCPLPLPGRAEDARPGSCDPPLPGRPGEKAPHGGEHAGLVEKEGVVTLVALDLDEADRGGGGVERMPIARESRVGKSQSEVKEMRQKRVFVPRNASASTPP